MAKYLYSDLTKQQYLSYHHLVKLNILRKLISTRLNFQGDLLNVCARILFYELEYEYISLLKIQKDRYLEKNLFFDKDQNLKHLRSVLGNLKKRHIRAQKDKFNKLHRKEGKKGVYVLLDAEYKKKLSELLKAKKTTITAMLIDLIDSETAKTFKI